MIIVAVGSAFLGRFLEELRPTPLPTVKGDLKSKQCRDFICSLKRQNRLANRFFHFLGPSRVLGKAIATVLFYSLKPRYHKLAVILLSAS